MVLQLSPSLSEQKGEEAFAQQEGSMCAQAFPGKSPKAHIICSYPIGQTFVTKDSPRSEEGLDMSSLIGSPMLS